MIIINTIDADVSTQKVVDWLIYYSAKFCIINDNSLLELEKLTKDKFVITIDKNTIELTKETTYWYRRGSVNFYRHLINKSNSLFENGAIIQKYLSKETSKIHDVINNFSFNNRIGNYADNKINKINILKMASNVGLDIPDFMITSKKEELITFQIKHQKIITKPISDMPIMDVIDGDFRVYTCLVEDELIDKLPNNFFPSLFQEYIDKKFELRVFFLDEDFYCCAILSQNDPKTKIDFRNYNKLNPNRIEPFLLPINIKKKITQLMKNNNMRIGVIDLIYSIENKFVFLEVNPVGQFGNISHYCFANLEKLIAQKLIQND